MATVDPSYQLLACQYLRAQLDALTAELRGVRQNEDIEPVHQARVASRRMRAAFRMFADSLDAKRFGKWQERVKKLTKGLGAARDRDVQIQFVAKFLDDLDPKGRKHRPGVGRLLLRLRQSRAALQPKVVKTLDRLEKGRALAEMHGELEKILFTLRRHDVQVQSPYVFKQAGRHVRERKQDLFAHEHALADSQDAAGHHQMRIAAKRLRYTMEICDPAYDGALAPFVKAVKKVQSQLGRVHDCDVWVENIDAFMEEERLRTIAYFGHDRPFHRLKRGLLLLREEQKTRRRQTFAELLAYWEELGDSGLWDKLETTLQSREQPVCQREPETQDEQADAAQEENNDDRTAQ